MTARLATLPLCLRPLAVLMAGWLVAMAATGPVAADAPIFNARAGTALGGYDVVAYFTQNAPVAGHPEHAVMWKGAIWRFETAANREAFEANPRAFAPQYGGYCAFAMSKGELSTTDPTAWTIYGGKLYLIHSPGVQSIWVGDIPGYVGKADAHWPAALRSD